MEELSLHAYKHRGLAEPIKMILKYLHISYDLLDPDTAEFGSSLDFQTFPLIHDNITNLEISHSIAISKYIAGKYRPKMLGSAMNEFAEVDSLLYLSYDIYKMVVTDLYERYETVINPKPIGKEINHLNKEFLACKLEKDNANCIQNGLDKTSEKGTVNGIKLEEEKTEECEIKLSKKVIECPFFLKSPFATSGCMPPYPFMCLAENGGHFLHRM